MIAHDFAEAFGGAERVLAEMARAFPGAPVYAIAGRDEVAERMGIADRFHTLLPSTPALLRHYRALTPAYPALVRRRRLPDADVLVSSSYAFAHGLRTVNDAPRVCFCHSPLRFAWTMTEEYARQLGGGPLRPVAGRGLGALAALMRRLDRRAAAGVDVWLAGCENVADMIRSSYGAEPRLVRPPVDTTRFSPGAGGGVGDHFLIAGRLVEPYKQVATAIRAFAGVDAELRIAGDGPAMAELRELAGPNVRFLGALGDEALIAEMRNCAAGIFPSRDDLGLAPLEIMACGRPVLAYGAGGALETVVAGVTGEFFPEQTPESLAEAVRGFHPGAYDPAAIRAHAEGWNPERFRAELAAVIAEVAGGG